MIDIVMCNEEGSGKCDTIDKLDKESKNVTWIDSMNPSPEEREKIAKAMDIDMDEILDSLDEEEHARVEVDNDYILIIYTVPFVEDDDMETSSFGIFIKGNTILTLHKNEVGALQVFRRAVMKTRNGYRKKLIGNRYFFLHIMLEYINRDFLKILNNIDDRLEELNEDIFKDPKDEHIQEILKHKKTLIYFSRGLLANREVLMLIKRGYLPEMNQDDVDNFIDLYSDTLQLVDMASTYKELTSSSMNLYHSSLSNSLNVTMKKLTILAVIFVVPTLISGIYGMNFSWMPFITDPLGFYYSLVIMLLLIALLVIYVKRNDL